MDNIFLPHIVNRAKFDEQLCNLFLITTTQQNCETIKLQEYLLFNSDCTVCCSIYQGITFEHAKEVRKSNLNPALFAYYKNPVFICKVRIYIQKLHDWQLIV